MYIARINESHYIDALFSLDSFLLYLVLPGEKLDGISQYSHLILITCKTSWSFA